jgi:serine phosphatase RsbU (regulator of sigma subunit)
MADRPKILIVDDEPFNIDFLEQELEDLGYETISASNGREALSRIAEESPDMVLLDIMMPVMDGFEVLRQIKAEPAWRDTPVVIVSAMTDLDSVIKGIELGAEDYLPKPFNPALLKARLNAGLGQKYLRDLEKKYLRSLERELEIGHQIQSGFLPRSLPQVNGWELAAYFQAAREVAGDFYDVFSLPDGKVGLFLGDVTDKGVGAALFMALYRSLLRASMGADLCEGQGSSIGDSADLVRMVVSRTNQYVCHTHEGALFATLFIGVLDPETGCLSYINAGHNPPIILRDGKIRLELTPNNPLIGVFEEVNYQAAEVEISADEFLLAYSDGVIDTLDTNESDFGNERLYTLINNPFPSASELIESITQRLSGFRGSQAPFDDVTLLAIHRRGA